MIDTQENTAEAKIKEAAEALFEVHGLKGTTVRKVAEKADVNVALVNYYFRSKENLFLSIFEEKYNTFNQAGIAILADRSKDIWTRIKEYVDDMVAAMQRDSHLPMFVMSETHYNPDLINQIKSFSNEEITDKSQKIQEILDEEYENGNIRKVMAIDFEYAMSSMVTFPFLTKNILLHSGRLEGDFDSFEDFIEHHKKNVTYALTSFLKK